MDNIDESADVCETGDSSVWNGLDWMGLNESNSSSGDYKRLKKDIREVRNLNTPHDASSLFLAGFDPKQGRKAKANLKENSYREDHQAPSTKIVKVVDVNVINNNIEEPSIRKSIYDENGLFLKNGLDLCDCLREFCPGCHFPCDTCSSSKCGHVCRNNRTWNYDNVTMDGIPESRRDNNFNKEN